MGKRTKFLALAGNIAAGKSSILTELQRIHPEYGFIFEPLNEFSYYKKHDGQVMNPLKEFYADSSNAIVTQLYFLDIYAKKIQELEHEKNMRDIIICDRWIFSCKLFTDALHMKGDITDFGWEYFTNKYYSLMSTLKYAYPDAVYYVDTPVDVCLQRQQQRGREMETNFRDMKLHLLCLESCYSELYKQFSPNCIFQKSKGQTLDQRVQEIEGIIARLQQN